MLYCIGASVQCCKKREFTHWLLRVTSFAASIKQSRRKDQRHCRTVIKRRFTCENGGMLTVLFLKVGAAFCGPVWMRFKKKNKYVGLFGSGLLTQFKNEIEDLLSEAKSILQDPSQKNSVCSPSLSSPSSAHSAFANASVTGLNFEERNHGLWICEWVANLKFERYRTPGMC